MVLRSNADSGLCKFPLLGVLVNINHLKRVFNSRFWPYRRRGLNVEPYDEPPAFVQVKFSAP